MHKPLTLRRVARENMRSKPVRSFFLIFLVFFFTLALLLGSLFIRSLANGVEQVSDRMGADIIVVPAGYKANVESVLLKGEPSSFYLPAEAEALVAQEPGIAKQTPQLYIATLAASCCSYPVQIIGMDPDSDFLIKPWLEQNLHRTLRTGEALVGSSIAGEPGQTIHFFNQELQIAGKLTRTGLGLDGTVFVNLETAHQLADASKRVGIKEAASQNQVSVILVRVKPGLDPQKVAHNITQDLNAKGLFAISSRSFVSNLSSKLQLLSHVILGVLVLLWVLCLVILALSFSAMTHERRRELAALRILGARRVQLRRVVLHEALQLSLLGSIFGTCLGIVVALILFPILRESFTIPLPTPGPIAYLIWVGITLAVGILVGPLASLPAVLHVGRREAYTTMREASGC